jgi:hypothetical protein
MPSALPPLPDRRRFLTVLASAAAGSAVLPVTLWSAVRVDAQPTPLYAQPDGRRCLVRFFVSGLDAPGGRLRVFAEGQRLLGTAGVVPLGDGRLYGELWLALGAVPRIRTELSAPGLHGPLVSWHTPRPAPRWTVYWLPLLPPAALEQQLAALDSIPRTVFASDARRARARLDPVPAAVPATAGDIPFLRLAEPAWQLAQATDLELGAVGTAAAPALATPTMATVLSGSGVRAVLVRGADRPGVHRLSGTDGSWVLAVVADADADAGRLGFFDGGRRMVQLVEQFLEPDAASSEAAWPSRVLSPGGTTGVALVTGADAGALGSAASAVEEWNKRFAYPRIVTGDPAPYFTAVQQQADRITAWDPRAHATAAPPTLAQADATAAARAAERARRADALIACLTRLLPGGRTGLDAIAAQFALPLPGTVVFNPSPYSRTELVTLADGTERMVTDLPALGYAYVPLGGSTDGTWQAMEGGDGGLTLETAQFRVVLDPDTGAIRSLVSQNDGREWVHGGVLGLNALDGAQLLEHTRSVLPGVGVRIVARRRSPEFGSVRSTVTVYDHLPHIDVVNHAAAPEQRAVRYRFAFAVDSPALTWEVPAGADRAPAPADVTHLRWVRLAGSAGTVTLGALDAAAAHVDETGMLTSYGPRGAARYRIAVGAPGAFERPGDPWRFGWGLEPLLTAPVPGTGAARLPSFGPLLVVDQPGVLIVGAQWTRGGDGVIVYLQELTGQQRVATVGAGLLGWTSAHLVDLIERDLGAPAMTMVNGAGVTLTPHGVAAVKLLGVRLAQS